MSWWTMPSVVVAVLLVSPTIAAADPYFNSAEPGCDPASPNPDFVLCDDFDDGDWAVTCNTPESDENDGWLLCNDTGGRGAFLPSSACGDGEGAAGTRCAAVSSPQGGDGGDSQLGMHGFYPDNTAYDELYVRFYLRLSPGYVHNDNQKFISFIRSAYQGGIDLGGAFGRSLSYLPVAPAWDCDDNDYRNPMDSTGSWCYLNQNQGDSIDVEPGRWFYVELHVRNNTFSVRDGLVEVWADDCGADGLGCTGAPTLRSRYTNVGFRGQGAGEPPSPAPSGAMWGTPTTPLMGSMWLDIWGNPSDVGSIYIDQLIAARAGPIGFVGGVPALRDGGVVENDAGSIVPDVDAGPRPGADSGTPGTPADPGGCSCRAMPNGGVGGAFAVSAMVAGWLVARSRRRTSSAR